MHAIQKNLDELQRATMIRISLDGIDAAGNIEFLFLKLVRNSLFNDYISKCIKIFEDGKQSASLLYIHRSNERLFRDTAEKLNIDISMFQNLVPKLKHLRDKAHFHLDREGIGDVNIVWGAANINEGELRTCVLSAQLILSELASKFDLKRETIPKEYNAVIPYHIAQAINSGNW